MSGRRDYDTDSLNSKVEYADGVVHRDKDINLVAVAFGARHMLRSSSKDVTEVIMSPRMEWCRGQWLK